MKKLFIKTHGCQMNFYDSERMTDLLKPHGYELDNSAEDADLIVLNTCHIREKAVEKTYSELGRIRDKIALRKEKTGKDSIVAVAGCVAQAQGKEIMRRSPWVDIVVGPQSFQNLPELIAKVDPIKKNKHVDINFPIIPKFDQLNHEVRDRGPSAFLTIQEGCDKFCTFCVVPYTRGAEFSRPVKSILAEARRLIEGGTVELNLLGQNVNAWHGEAEDGQTWSFGRLLYALAELDGLKRIRYTTSHPLDMHDELYRAHAEIPQLMPYLHLPVQSGSDRILAAMNRRHDRDTYFRIIDRLRDARPNMALSGDFIVGFPGETDRDFADTLNLIDRVNYASAYSFKYSPRPGTPAASHEDQIDEAVKSERLAGLQQLLASQQQMFNHSKLGEVMDVLVERPASREGQKAGRSPWMQAVHFSENSGEIGDIIPVKIVAAYQNSLAGERVIT